jgi:hypothetical protein
MRLKGLLKKAKLFLCLTKHCLMEVLGGVGAEIRISSTSALVGGEWSASGLGLAEKFSGLIGNRTRYLPTCSLVPQSTAVPRAPFHC